MSKYPFPRGGTPRTLEKAIENGLAELCGSDVAADVIIRHIRDYNRNKLTIIMLRMEQKYGQDADTYLRELAEEAGLI